MTDFFGVPEEVEDAEAALHADDWLDQRVESGVPFDPRVDRFPDPERSMRDFYSALYSDR